MLNHGHINQKVGSRVGVEAGVGEKNWREKSKGSLMGWSIIKMEIKGKKLTN